MSGGMRSRLPRPPHVSKHVLPWSQIEILREQVESVEGAPPPFNSVRLYTLHRDHTA